jgi:WD40 repeat protein
MSHSSRDNRQAIAVVRWLEAEDPSLSGEVFLDLDQTTGIRTGQRWTEALWRANARCEAVICLLSGSWAASPECRAEFRQAEGTGKPILCARIETFDEADATSAWQRCDLFGDGPAVAIDIGDGQAPVELLESGLQRLLAGLRAVGVGADSFAWPPAADPDRSPYRGWQPLESADAAIYFGRDTQIVRALDELRQMRDDGRESIFVILGPTGVGKSSFLRAGLLPRLDRDDHNYLSMPIVRPARHTLTGDNGLAHSIHGLRAGVGLTTPSLGEIKNGVTDAGQVRRWLTEAATEATNRRSDAEESQPPPTLVLPLDQAEELFGSNAGAEAQGLLALLSALLTAAGPPVLLVVVTIRSDRYEPLQTAPQLSAVQSHLFDRLKPLPPAQFAEVICGPARRAAEAGSRFAISPELVEQLVEDASQGADTLPLLALTLSRLYGDYSGSQSAVTITQYEAMGGIHGVVQTEIDALLSADPAARDDELRRLRSAFIPWLATVDSETERPMRRIGRWADLSEDSHTLVDAFVSRRLLVKGERDGQVVVEVALESLLEQWDQLAGWLREEAADLRDTDALERAQVAWERNGRRDDWLLDGERLAGAENLCTQTGFGVRLQPAGEFVLASRRHANQKLEDAKHAAESHAKSLRRRSQVLSALMVLVVVAAAGLVYNLNRARAAENRAMQETVKAVTAKLIGQSRAMLGGTQQGGDRRALQQILAAEAFSPGSDPDALLNTVVDERQLLKTIRTPNRIKDLAVSPDGTEVAVAGSDGRIRRWEMSSGKAIGEFSADGDTKDVDSVTYSRDGRWLATAGEDGIARIWDVHTGSQRALDDGKTDAWAAAFSPDASLVATGSKDGTVRLWKTTTGEQVGEPIHVHDGVGVWAAFSPDGKTLVSQGFDGDVRLWDAATRLPRMPQMPRLSGPAISLAFTGDNRLVALSMILGTQSGPSALGTQIQIVDIDMGRVLMAGPVESGPSAAQGMASTRDGRHLATATADNRIHLLDPASGTDIGSPITSHGGSIQALALSPDASRLISATDTELKVWPTEADPSIGNPLPGADDRYQAVAVSPDGKTVATRDPRNYSDIALWQIDTGARTSSISTGQRGPASALAFRPDGRVIAAADGADFSVRQYDVASRAPVGHPLTGPTDIVMALAMSPDGHHIAAGGQGGQAWLWDTTRQPVHPGKRLPVNSDVIGTVAFSADGQRLLAVSPLHTAGGGGESNADVGHPFTTTVLAPSSAQVWNTDTGEPVGPAITGRTGTPTDVAMKTDDHPPISAGSISPDGKRIAVASPNAVRLYDVNSGQQIGNPWKWDSMATVTAVAYTGDGKLVVIALGSPSVLQVVDAETGRPIGPQLPGLPGPADMLSTGAGDRYIATRAPTGWMIFPGPAAWRDTLCDKLTDGMTADEWREWVSSDIAPRTTCPDGSG